MVPSGSGLLRVFGLLWYDVTCAPCREFAKRLWGDIWFQEDTRMFRRKAPQGRPTDRSFVQFILEPLYKIYSQVIGEYGNPLEHSLDCGLCLC